MSFYATRFVFDGVPSENFSLTISSSNSEDTTNMPGDVKLYSEKLFRRTDEFLYGVSVEPMLEFPVTFITDDTELTAKDSELIGRWLFGRNNYSRLKIVQPDMTDLYYNCFFINPKIVRMGNIVRGFSATVHCKEAWGVTEPKTFTYNFTPNAFNDTIIHVNSSDHSGYTYPTLVLTSDGFGGQVGWQNFSDNNRTGLLDNLAAGEIITIDNSLQIISSSMFLSRLSLFNKKFLRLKSGVNRIGITGAISSFKLIYPLAKKIGG